MTLAHLSTAQIDECWIFVPTAANFIFFKPCSQNSFLPINTTDDSKVSNKCSHSTIWNQQQKQKHSIITYIKLNLYHIISKSLQISYSLNWTPLLLTNSSTKQKIPPLALVGKKCYVGRKDALIHNWCLFAEETKWLCVRLCIAKLFDTKK